MERGKLAHWGTVALWGTGALIVVALAGYLWGWSGASTFRDERDRALLRLQLAQATGLVLEARVNIYTTNFGNASNRLEQAKEYVVNARPLLQAQGPRAQVPRLEQAIQAIDEAQELARKFNQDANSRAERAQQLLRGVYWTTPSPRNAGS